MEAAMSGEDGKALNGGTVKQGASRDGYLKDGGVKLQVDEKAGKKSVVEAGPGGKFEIRYAR